jgi:hypothetical protein
VEKVKLTKLPTACLIASTTHQDKEWSILLIIIIRHEREDFVQFLFSKIIGKIENNKFHSESDNST